MVRLYCKKEINLVTSSKPTLNGSSDAYNCHLLHYFNRHQKFLLKKYGSIKCSHIRGRVAALILDGLKCSGTTVYSWTLTSRSFSSVKASLVGSFHSLKLATNHKASTDIISGRRAVPAPESHSSGWVWLEVWKVGRGSDSSELRGMLSLSRPGLRDSNRMVDFNIFTAHCPLAYNIETENTIPKPTASWSIAS